MEGQMKRVALSLMAVCALCLLSLGVRADDHDKMLKEKFEFKSEVWIGDTKVEKGMYLVKYNTETGTMKVMQGDKVIAKAKATVMMNEKDFDSDALLTKTTAKGEQLIGLRLGGQKEELTITENVASSN
jgi:hypothetical protein